MKLKYIPLAAFLLFSTLTGGEMTLNAAPTIQIGITTSSTNGSPRDYTKEEVKELVKMAIGEILDISEYLIPDDALLMQDLGLDSIDMLELIIKCEELFSISFNEADALFYSSVFTVESFSLVIYHFCTSNSDYNA
jgi:acyl carrier protein